MINYFVLKRVNIFTLEYDGLKIYSDNKSKHFSINDLEKIILEKLELIGNYHLNLSMIHSQNLE